MSSICPIHLAESAVGDPLYAFRHTLADATSRLGRDPGVAVCVPLALPRNSSGAVSCTVLATLPGTGDESICAALGLEVPDAGVLRQLRSRREAEWRKSGGAATRLPNPQDVPTCVVPQLVGADVGADGCCFASQKAGWCVGTSSPSCAPAQELVLSSMTSEELPCATFTVACSDGC